MKFAICFVLLGFASSARVMLSHNHDLAQKREATISMQMYRGDCGKSRAVRGFSMLEIPGAGVLDANGTLNATGKVLKDGFYMVQCTKDAMYQFGDKYGDNKHEYNRGDVTGVSIVHYERHVEKLEREDMTHEVCFAFCRTVPDMLFFGITNGRTCYCTPYYEPEASDSSSCDATCVGKPSQMCGGKTKSSVFQMHMCANTADDLTASNSTMHGVQSDLADVHGVVDGAATFMQEAGAALQAKFGKVGDPEASNLMQSAKAFAGKLEHAAEDGQDVLYNMGNISTVVSGLSGADFSDVGKITEAEGAVSDMEQASTAGELQLEKLGDLAAIAKPSNDNDNAHKQYYPIMYFVDKSATEYNSTCSGEAAHKPLVGSLNDCAAACDAAIHSCVGFSHFKHGTDDSGLCFLFSKFNTAQYYTDCETAAPAQCMAKLSSFEGTTLKPNPSGKCDQCLKKVTKANRCY